MISKLTPRSDSTPFKFSCFLHLSLLLSQKLFGPTSSDQQVFTLPSCSLPSQYRSLLPARDTKAEELVRLERSSRRIRNVVLALVAILIIVVVGIVSLVAVTLFHYGTQVRAHNLHGTKPREQNRKHCSSSSLVEYTQTLLLRAFFILSPASIQYKILFIINVVCFFCISNDPLISE